MSWKLRNITDDELKRLVKNSTSVRQVLLSIGLSGGGSFRILSDRIRSLNVNIDHFTGKTWNKGHTKDTHPSVKICAEKTSLLMTGKIGLTPSHETRQKMSLSACERSFSNNVRVKRYEVLNIFTNEIVTVQGTWEKRYAEWLNENQIQWERPKQTFAWKMHPNDISHTYHPDFYLIETDCYVEIKGYMWKNIDKNIDDERKMRLVLEQNPSIKICILMHPQLRNMGVL